MKHLHLAVIARSFVAILAGFATMAVLVMLLTIAMNKAFPELVGDPAHPKRAYLLANIGYSAVFAIAGGYVTAVIASADPLRNVFMLALVTLVLSALSALQLRGQQPLVYQFALVVITPIAVLAGGLLCMHAAGYRW
jgi:hypothetical protein